MVFINNIEDLQYYNPTPGTYPCYCETVIFPSDMILQSPLNYNGNGSYTMEVQLLSADGLTVIENDITASFDIYFFNNPITGLHTFTMRLKAFTAEMCNRACYILHVVVASEGVEYFNKFTERYCQNDCCDYARGITITQGLLIPVTPTAPVPSTPKRDGCGRVFVTLRSYNDCYDAQTGKYYGTPSDVLSGTPFEFQDLTNMQGVIQATERDIERTYSFNCNLTRASSQRQYELKALQTFPTWKMLEITNQFHAQNIFVEDIRYEFQGGSLFTRVSLPNFCYYEYTLLATLSDCNIFQIHGCNSVCKTGNSISNFLISVESDKYYNEAKALIGTTPEEVELYFTNLPNVVSATLFDDTSYDCTFAFGVTVEYNGFVPNTIYAGGISPTNKIYSITEAQLADICTNLVVPCGTVIVHGVTISTDTCTAGTIGTIEITPFDEVTVLITPINDWVDAGNTSVIISQGVVTMGLDLFNETLPYLSDPMTAPGINEIVAVVDEAARPSVVLSFTFDGYIVNITPEGNVYYSGYPTSGDLTGSNIDVSIIYNNG